ncbi:hypothetical protein [Lentzea sp. HUAS12]|uniref:hypothetical protein n=1 Tax=Lentzea sp. HUAS12 TaxID=2951806 RepID=UPI0020A05473|nr:hypothetical protein [Lentzea sp. HUAS12]USX55809.1 hypothetical protein ND450_17435 [Lentzea sp. HUAS12]
MTLDEAIRAYQDEGYEVTHVVESVCGGCGGKSFTVQMTEDQAVRRTCLACGLGEFIGDSDEHWDEDDAEECECTCGGEDFAAALGSSCLPDGEVRWLTVGLRCLECGLAGVYEDWKIDYLPSRHLVTRA